MNLFRTLSTITLLGLTVTGLSSCLNAPNYPVEPAIDFKEIQVTHIPAGVENAKDEINFVLNFRDGDGDLGLSQEDIHTAPYNQAPPSTVPQRNHATNEYNYFIQPFLKNSAGQFVQFVTLPPFGKVGQYDGTFLRLDGTNAKPAPLRGELRYKLPIFIDGASFFPGQVFRFEITIMDRALHVSNTITTSEIKLGL